MSLTQRATVAKNVGNRYFKNQDYDKAIMYYTQSVEAEPNAVSYNNRAMAYMKLQQWTEAANDCDNVLSSADASQKDKLKAHYRRGVCMESLQRYADALRELDEVLKVSPNNREATMAMERVRNAMQQEDSKNSNSTSANTNAARSSGEKKPRRRLPIVEVDDDDDDDDDDDGDNNNNVQQQQPTTTTTKKKKKQANNNVTRVDPDACPNPQLLHQIGGEKHKGGEAFKDGRHDDAIACYAKALELAERMTSRTDAHPKYLYMAATVYSNRSACFMQVERHKRAVDDCGAGVQLLERIADAVYAEQVGARRLIVKLLMRRAFAYESLGRPVDALFDMRRVSGMDPSIAQARQVANRLTRSIRQHCDHTLAELKLKGNDYFRAKEYKLANEAYTRALDMFEVVPQIAGKHGMLQLQLLSNRCFGKLRLKHFGGAVTDATKGLELIGRLRRDGVDDSGSEQLTRARTKCLYRRALAYQGLENAEAAGENLRMARQTVKEADDAELERALMPKIEVAERWPDVDMDDMVVADDDDDDGGARKDGADDAASGNDDDDALGGVEPPKTFDEFIGICDEHGDNDDLFYKYVRAIDGRTLFADTQTPLSNEHLHSIFTALTRYARDDVHKCAEFLAFLSTTEDFSINIVLIDDSDAKLLKNIMVELRKSYRVMDDDIVAILDDNVVLV